MNLPICTTSAPPVCELAQCRWRCALDVIDELMSQSGTVSGDEVDHLLDLRWKLRQRDDAEGTLKLFCDLRIRMEHRHYLAFFRMRRWLENHLLAGVRVCPAAGQQFVAVKLDHYCVQAVRRICLCAAVRRGTVLLAPRLRFTFREIEAGAAAVSMPALGSSIHPLAPAE